MSDLINRQAAIDAIMGQPPEPHYPAWYAAQIEKLPAVQPDHNADVSKRVDVDDCISRRHVIDAMKDMYRAAEKWLRDATDDVTKARAESCMASLVEIKLHTEKLPAVQPDHVADIDKKAEGDCISRQAVIEALQKEIDKGIPPFDDVIGSIRCGVRLARNIVEDLPSATPSTTQTTNTTAPSTDDWIPVERELPEDLAEVNVTWVNHEPEPYYEPIKSKPFTASAVYYEGNWYWYSSVCADVLAEYGRNDVDKVDDTIEITAWMPLPEPYQGGEKDDR